MPCRRLRLPLLLACAGCGSLFAAPAAAEGITEYTAAYEAHYNGRHAANAEFRVAAGPDGSYEFSSTTAARGLYRLAAPRPVVERSRFELSNSRILPSRFEYEDGSRKGEDNYSIDFDAVAGEVRITGPAASRRLAHEAGLLDRGSLQVALMLDLAACRRPGPYRYVDDDGIRTYDYERLADDSADTGIGQLATVRFAQQRAGSSRRTIIWFASDYAYVPVRIEQIEDGEAETDFILERLEGVERAEPACSDFR